MPKHTDGFIAVDAPDVLYLLTHGPDIQFWRLTNWPQLFYNCGCCKAQKIGTYQMISADEARAWAEERVDA
jgi:hypothetical protein